MTSRFTLLAAALFTAGSALADVRGPRLPASVAPALPLAGDPDGDYPAYCDSEDAILDHGSYLDCFVDYRFDGFRVAVHRPVLPYRSASDIGVMLDVIRAQITMVRLRVPATAVARLKETPIIVTDIDVWCGEDSLGCYLNGADAILLHARPDSEGLTLASSFPATPGFVFHEMAHAYHWNVIGIEDECIIRLYNQAAADGRYADKAYNHSRLDPTVHTYPGRSESYAMVNHKEFFAVFSEAYFTGSAWEPYNRAQLMETDRWLAVAIRDLWAVGSCGP